MLFSGKNYKKQAQNHSLALHTVGLELGLEQSQTALTGLRLTL